MTDSDHIPDSLPNPPDIPDSNPSLPASPSLLSALDFDFASLTASNHSKLKMALKGVLPDATSRVRACVSAFLWETVQGETFRKAAKAAEINWATIRQICFDSPAFQELYDLCREIMRTVQTHEREDALHERGVDGWIENVYHKGVVVGAIRRYSDKCLEIGLQAENPGKYRDKPDATVNLTQTISFVSIGADHAPTTPPKRDQTRDLGPDEVETLDKGAE